MSIEDTPPPLPEDVVISCGNSTKADIIFLLDASSSIGATNWRKQLKFASDLVEEFSFGPTGNLFGAVIFTSTPTKIFDLNTYLNKTAVARAILEIPYPNTVGTYTDAALAFIRTNDMFGTSSGGRENAQNILIVMTDGQSYFPTLTISEAQKLKDAGVSIVAVGIGLTDLIELNAVASQNSFVFTASSFDVLSTINESLLKITCDIQLRKTLLQCQQLSSSTASPSTDSPSTASPSTATTQTTPQTSTISSSAVITTTSISSSSPTVTSSTSISSSGQAETSMATASPSKDTPPPLPEDVVISCGNSTKADIIFLLDASSSIGATNWRKQLKFSSDLVEEFSFGPTGNLFGAVIFTSTPTKIFDLNTYLNKTAVARAILEIPYPNTVGTYTDAALAFIRTNHMFGTSSGGRENAQNILIVMTDGQSYFPTLTISEAQKLKDAGVSIVAIGIGLTDLIELNAVASQTGFVFTASSFDVLSTINESLLKITCDISNGNVSELSTTSFDASSTTTQDFTAVPTTLSTASPSTASTSSPSTASPSTASPSTASPSTASPSTASPSTDSPSTASPSTATIQTTPQTSTKSPSVVTTTTSISSSSPSVTSSTSISSSGQAETSMATTSPSSMTKSTSGSITVEDTPPPLPEDVVISCGNSTKADIIFLLDASSSIGATNWRKQLKFASDLVEEFSFGPTGNLFGAVIFTSTPTKIFDLNTYLNKTAVARAILEIPYPNTVGTYTDAALAFIRTNHMFGTSSGGRENAQNILIVMTDGQSYFPTLTISEAQKLKDAGVSIVAIGIGLTDLIELNAVASQTGFVFTASSFDVLSTINESLLKITCDIINNFIRCKQYNYARLHCSANNFINSLSINSVNILSINCLSINCLSINSLSINSLSINSLFINTSPSTASPSTDSPSTASPSTATTQTTPQKSTISSSAVITTTSISSSSPTVTSSTSISSSGQAETSMATTSPSSTTQSTSGSITVEDTPPPLPEDVVISCGNSTKADIIFLLDASSSIGATNWRKQLKFSSDLVEEFSFGPTGNLFGAVIFTSTPTKIFDLNTYLNKTAVARAILEIPYPNTVGTYTDAALAFIRTNHMFGTSSGGRENAQNILIVMTDGQSYFPTLTISEAQKLKDAGVSIVAIGIGLTDLKELNAVASQTGFVFTASSFDVLSTINESLLKITCDSKLKIYLQSCNLKIYQN
ncbi:hypothetical protein Btru_057467 [Bulinus truncatus]|nr:hypothetical protein Btru_057467 [Bulinus truncatus]